MAECKRKAVTLQENMLFLKEVDENPQMTRIFSLVEKLMRTSQSNQLKMLRVLLERETADVMRKLQATRREEVKALSKIHKDKDEMVRIKREVASAMVEKGVHERVRLTQIYEKKRENLERQHDQVRMNFEEERSQVRANLLREYEGRYAKVEEDLTPASSSSDLPVA